MFRSDNDLFRMYLLLIVQEPRAETTEVTTDHGFVLKLAISVDMNNQYAWKRLLFCWDTTMHNIDLQGFEFTSDRFEHSAGR